MTVTPTSPVVGIFKDRSMAEQAIDALYHAGFTSEQIRYSAPGTAGSILADLKSLFTGQNVSGGNIANDLTTMGLSDEEAQYYASEYKNGNTILAVSASSREQEVLNILHQYGAYNARTNDTSPRTTYSQQPSGFTQAAVYTPEATQPVVYTPEETLSQRDSTPTWATQEQPSDAEHHPLQNAQQNIVTSDPTSTSQTASSSRDSDAVPEYQATSSESTGTDVVPEYQATSSDALGTDSAAEPQDAQTDVTASDALGTDSTVGPHATQADATAADAEGTDSTPTSQNTPPATTAPSEYEDEFQQLQAQLQAAQQQLQDARAQLQAAKEHEAQIQTIRERERQLQAARQQLQDIQAQLQTTLAELHETHQRISQHQ